MDAVADFGRRFRNVFRVEALVDRLPRLAAVARTLDELSEPPGALRGIEAVRIRRRSLDVVHLPAAEMRPVDLPSIALAVRGQDERAFARPYEHSHTAHRFRSCS